ncbi:MAG: hypothetical protein H7Y20_09780 [Bryobacteraceae bacterium]|nr:hypothetical protein [Bryobacteraceae bacterium]
MESVFREQYQRIARTIGRIIRDPGRAEELAVDVFLRFSSRSSACAGSEVPWLFRTAVRLALDELRRQSLRERPAGRPPGFPKPSKSRGVALAT